MAEKGGTKILAIVTIIIVIISIGLSGCVEEGDKKKEKESEIKYAKPDDLELGIELLNSRKNNIWELEDGLRIRLSNINSTPIKIDKNLIFGSNIKGFIKTPQNVKYNISYSTAIYYRTEEHILKPDEYIEDTSTFGGRAYCEYDFNTLGTHSIQLYYTGVIPHVYSNVIEFEINQSKNYILIISDLYVNGIVLNGTVAPYDACGMADIWIEWIEENKSLIIYENVDFDKEKLKAINYFNSVIYNPNFGHDWDWKLNFIYDLSKPFKLKTKYNRTLNYTDKLKNISIKIFENESLLINNSLWLYKNNQYFYNYSYIINYSIYDNNQQKYYNSTIQYNVEFKLINKGYNRKDKIIQY